MMLTLLTGGCRCNMTPKSAENYPKMSYKLPKNSYCRPQNELLHPLLTWCRNGGEGHFTVSKGAFYRKQRRILP